MLDVRIEVLFLLCGCNDVYSEVIEVIIRFRLKMRYSLEVYQTEV